MIWTGRPMALPRQPMMLGLETLSRSVYARGRLCSPANRVVVGGSFLHFIVLRFADTELGGHFHQIGQRVGLHFLHHLTSMSLYSDLADAEFSTNLFVQSARDY